jgi:NAD(P)-dependent dehydrogenase (short-subunit alcohol dehydrogenase family)
MELSGRKALVTGAGSRGIGRATARALAAAGADVAVHYLDQRQAAEALAGEIRAAGRTSAALAADLSDPAAARAMVRRAAEALAGLSVLVACAATLARRPFLEIDDAEWDRVHAVNMRGTFAVAQEAAKVMAEADAGGRIVLVSSVNQDHPTRHLAHYVASKGGVRMLARAMALELAPLGITVNLVAPGTVETDINRAALADPAFRAEKVAMIPAGRVAAPEEVAAAAVYLASPAASYVTGATITVDGGLTL